MFSSDFKWKKKIDFNHLRFTPKYFYFKCLEDILKLLKLLCHL